MSVTVTTKPAPLGAITAFRVITFFERAVDAVAAWRNARATAKALADLSDRQLADIGLNRGDIDGVAATLANR